MSETALASERIDLRLPKATKELIEHAAMIEEMSLSAFVIINAKYAAKQIIAENSRMLQQLEEKRRFVKALEQTL